MEQPFASAPNEQRPYPDPLPPSFRLNGRYQVARMLASTNLSTVYRGIDLRTRVPVAIKRLSTQLRPGGLPRAEAQRAFVAEALLLKSIDHPQVPRMHDLIRDHGDYFMVLDYIGGQRLDALLEDEPLSRERAVAIARSLCAAAEALHRAGIVHADIKPNNVIVRPGDRVTLLDFGLARRVGQPAALDAAMGTPPYAPPEQWLSEPLDARSDVYALGHVLGELGMVQAGTAVPQRGVDRGADGAGTLDVEESFDRAWRRFDDAGRMLEFQARHTRSLAQLSESHASDGRWQEYALHGLSMDTNPAIMCRVDGPEVAALSAAFMSMCSLVFGPSFMPNSAHEADDD